MGKHSSDTQWPFYRSVAGWFLPWTFLLVTLVVGTWYAMNALGGEEMEPPPRATGGGASATPTPTPTERESSPTPSPTPKNKKARKKPSPSPEEPKLITENISLQVLNATGVPQADDRLADRLSKLGFRVVALGGANREYQQTTVFWSYRDAKPAAEALAERMGWQVGPKPSNLSTTVALHVIVGHDEV